MLRLGAVLIVVLVVIAAGATLKVDKRCDTLTKRTVSFDEFADGSDVSEASTCDWRVVWRY